MWWLILRFIQFNIQILSGKCCISNRLPLGAYMVHKHFLFIITIVYNTFRLTWSRLKQWEFLEMTNKKQYCYIEEGTWRRSCKLLLAKNRKCFITYIFMINHYMYFTIMLLAFTLIQLSLYICWVLLVWLYKWCVPAIFIVFKLTCMR